MIFQLPLTTKSPKLRTSYILFISSGLLILLMLMSSFSCREKVKNARIVIYQQGKETVLNPELAGYEDVIKTAENLLITADDLLRLIVDFELIQKIKKEESAIEIIYPEPIELPSSYNREVIHPDRILIPLSGEFVGKEENPPAVIFHGYPEYSSGPYVNSKGIAELMRILHGMGIK